MVFSRNNLRLVAKALFVAIRLHALFTLMLTDFCLTALFQTSHSVGRLIICLVKLALSIENGWRFSREQF